MLIKRKGSPMYKIYINSQDVYKALEVDQLVRDTISTSFNPGTWIEVPTMQITSEDDLEMILELLNDGGIRYSCPGKEDIEKAVERLFMEACGKDLNKKGD
ncbi:MAG: hypothetical protein GY804_08850 [Alphaproteobacteria bacterium]|nr:hypothetical protein [Alphaproteobacteria bacterium]